MFWTQNISKLFEPVLLPTDYMTIDDKLNALTRLIIFVCLILALILQDARMLLLMIILVLLIVIVYNYQNKFTSKADSFLNKKEIDVVDNVICNKPTKNNPFMNPNLLDMFDDIPACPVWNQNVNQQIDDMFDSGMYRNSDDIYDRTTSKRQFYTMPSTTIPNDRTAYANWLYNREPTCKENNGAQCYENLYNDLRL